jgi:type IV pilus assembly protein PilA
MLARIRKAMEEREEGFTLIELLVVIIIIGILAAIAIPVFLNQRKKGYNASIKSDLRAFAQNEESYFTDAQSYADDYTTGPPTQVLTDVKISPNNVLSVAINSTNTAYCIKGSNPKSDAVGGTGTFYWYDSAAGGLQASASASAVGATCTSVAAAAWHPVQAT